MPLVGPLRRDVVGQLYDQFSLRTLLVDNLCAYMALARAALAGSPAAPETISVEPRVTHNISVAQRLRFVKYIAWEAVQDIATLDASRIWEALVELPACPWDQYVDVGLFHN